MSKRGVRKRLGPLSTSKLPLHIERVYLRERYDDYRLHWGSGPRRDAFMARIKARLDVIGWDEQSTA